MEDEPSSSTSVQPQEAPRDGGEEEEESPQRGAAPPSSQRSADDDNNDHHDDNNNDDTETVRDESATMTTLPSSTTTSCHYREVTQPVQLEAIVAQNPVLRDIRTAGAAARREDVYPADGTADYAYAYLSHFPPDAYALPQSFRKVIRGLHAGHWLSKKIEELRNRRWRRGGDVAGEAAPYGKLSVEEALALQRCNPAFWELYIQQKPPEEVLRKRQEQYDKKKAHNLKKPPRSSSSSWGSSPENTAAAVATNGRRPDGTAIDANDDAAAVSYREVVDPNELEVIVQQNPVLRDIRMHGAAARREDVYPADSTAEYVYTFLSHFPTTHAFALPQTFRKVIRGLHAGHWLSKKIEEIKNRRWRDHASVDDDDTSTTDRPSSSSSYGKLSLEEAQKLQRCNAAFWHLYIQRKPSEDVIRKRREQYEKKTAHNRSSRISSTTTITTTATAGGLVESTTASVHDVPSPPMPPRRPPPSAWTGTSPPIAQPEEAATVAVAASSHPDDHQNHNTSGEEYTELVDPTAVTRLEDIVKNNPVLLKIREYGPVAKREDVFPTNSTLEAEEYVYTFLRNFPENTYALPQIFRKVVKGLNSSHWLAKKVDELKNRRWRIHNTVREFGRLSDEEVHKIREANPAFWECFMQKQPPAEVLQKKQMQYDRKTANVKQARTGRPQDSAGKRDVPRSPKLSKKTRIVNRAAAAANRVHTSPSGYTELIDPTAVDALEEIVQNNPVLSKIRECGVKAKREDVYPTSSTLQAETYVYTYLKHFPENTFALPPTFRKVVRGLNASHWLAKKVIEMKDRRWRAREGQDSEYGRMSLEEVEKVKACNPAFWELYINKQPPPEILDKKRKQYARKTENNKTYRALKKPKTEDGQEEDDNNHETENEGSQDGGENVAMSVLPEPFATEPVAPDAAVVAEPEEPVAPEEAAAAEAGMVYL